MAEGVQGLARLDLDRERVAGLGVEDRGDDLIGGLVPEQSNVDAVAVAAVELSDHRSGGVCARARSRGTDPERRYGGITLGGIIVIVGIVLTIVWSFWIGLIIALVGLVVFGGFARGKGY
jgi:hypothetical protein